MNQKYLVIFLRTSSKQSHLLVKGITRKRKPRGDPHWWRSMNLLSRGAGQRRRLRKKLKIHLELLIKNWQGKILLQNLLKSLNWGKRRLRWSGPKLLLIDNNSLKKFETGKKRINQESIKLRAPTWKKKDSDWTTKSRMRDWNINKKYFKLKRKPWRIFKL